MHPPAHGCDLCIKGVGIVSVLQPDLYIASIGRSGSTLIANWLSRPDLGQYIFVEPNLTQGISPLLQTQLQRFHLTNNEADGPDSPAALAALLAGRQWGVKEVKGELHDALGSLFQPRRVVVTVRDITEVYLSLVEKHRIQGVEERFDPEWSRQYCVRESGYIHQLARSRPEYYAVRYQDFVCSAATRSALAAFSGFTGGGAVDFNFDLYNRSYETGYHQGEIRMRKQGYRTITDQDIQAARKVAGDCADYQQYFGYSG